MWNWLRTRRKTPLPGLGQQDAERALEREDQKIGDLHRQGRTIHSEAGTLKRLGEQNDFAGKLRRAMGGAG